MSYICGRKCYTGGRLYEVGEPYRGEGTPPVHFVPAEDFTGELEPVVAPVFNQTRTQNVSVPLNEAVANGDNHRSLDDADGKRKRTAKSPVVD